MTVDMIRCKKLVIEDDNEKPRILMAVFPDGPFDLQCYVLGNLGAIHWYLRDHRKALALYRKEEKVRLDAGDLLGLAFTRYNIILVSGDLVVAGEMEWSDLDALIRSALDTAVSAGYEGLEAELRIILGDRLEGEAAVVLLGQGLDQGGFRVPRRGLGKMLYRIHSYGGDRLGPGKGRQHGFIGGCRCARDPIKPVKDQGSPRGPKDQLPLIIPTGYEGGGGIPLGVTHLGANRSHMIL